MILDVQTLLIADAAVVTIAGASFMLNTVLGRHDDVGRLWSTAFIAGILTTLSYALAAAQPTFWLGNAVGNGSLVMAVGAMWSGCRRYNDRRGLIWVPLIAAGIAVGSVVVDGPSGSVWAGAVWMFGGIALFSGLASIETVRGRLLTAASARVLTIVFVVVSLYYLARTAVLIVDGENGTLFTTWFGTSTTTLITIVLVIVAAISMSVLQAGRAGGTVASAAGASDIPGVLSNEVFDQHAADWLRRGRTARLPMVLILLEVHELGHLNAVFGREFGDRVIVSAGRIACEKSPPASVVGRLASRRFAILTASPSHGTPDSVAEVLQTAIVETPIDPSAAVRAVTTFGVATTDREGYRMSDLRRAAESALAATSPSRAGEIVVADDRITS